MVAVIPFKASVDRVTAKASAQVSAMLNVPDSWAVMLERNPHIAQHFARRKAALASVLALVAVACGSPSPGGPEAADAGPTCIEKARVCLDAAEVKADVAACRAVWETCEGRDQ